MPNAIVMTGYGPPEVLKWAQVALPEPGQGQVRIKVRAAGISPGWPRSARPDRRSPPGAPAGLTPR
jgi:NADPH:quinone reductase-like Zn-dependent oxidoreductase